MTDATATGFSPAIETAGPARLPYGSNRPFAGQRDMVTHRQAIDMSRRLLPDASMLEGIGRAAAVSFRLVSRGSEARDAGPGWKWPLRVLRFCDRKPATTRFTRHILAALLTFGLALPAARAETDTLRLGVQPGLSYLPFAVIEHEALIEKAAAAAGMPGLKVSYPRFSGGPAMNDGLLSGNIDIASTGIPSFLALWAKGRGRFVMRGLMSYGSIPITLVTRNPNVRKVADFTDVDRIALPGVKTSVQAIFLGMAAEAAFGPGQAGRLDAITVTRSHPDGLAAMLGNTEINSHFTIQPYLQLELARPDIHPVTTSAEIAGTPVSNGVTYLPDAFWKENPKVVTAVFEAVKQAVAMINADPAGAARMYLDISGERTRPAEVQAMITAPGSIYDITPRGMMAIAKYLHRTGVIGTEPAGWQDLFLPLVLDEPGN